MLAVLYSFDKIIIKTKRRYLRISKFLNKKYLIEPLRSNFISAKECACIMLSFIQDVDKIKKRYLGKM